MQVYTVISEFDLTPLNQTLQVGDTLGKFDGQVLTTVNGSEYDNKALYDWLGSADSLNYLSFTGTVPDPSTGSGVPATPVATPSGPSDTGTQGIWATDGTYLYWCIATDTWVRWVVATSW